MEQTEVFKNCPHRLGKSCGKFFHKKRMRKYIMKHLVLKDIDPHPKNCGFFGMIELVILARGKSAVATPHSTARTSRSLV